MTTAKDAEPEYLSTFCPILSHAVLKPADLKKPEKQMLIPLGPDITSAAQAAAEPPEAEYIGCQGPSCAFFMRAEGRCCLPMLTQAAAVLVTLEMKREGLSPATH